MGRTPKTIRKKGTTTAAQMQRAIDLTNNSVSIRRAAKECGIPYQTLQRYVKKFKKGEMERLEPNYSVNKDFTHEQELTLHDYIIECADKFFGLTSKECCRIAYQMAKINNIKMPKSWEINEMAGRDWLRGFKRRFSNLSVRKPEACSLARATAFNRSNVERFYKNLKEVYVRHPQFGDGSRVYNLDETSTTTVQKPQKVLAPKGRSVCKVTSGERGVLVTTACIVNAHGQSLPPVMVFPRKNYKPNMIYGAPPGTLGLANPSGWMTADLFVDVMRHFIKYSSASKDNPALLIMDNHESHLSINALDLAKATGVTVLTLHPHTTAKMQPLDVGLYGPFKVYYNAAVDSFMMRNPGRGMTIYNVAECVGQAYLKSMTPSNIINAFKKCGIYPFDDQIFTDIDFLPSCITDRPAAEDNDDTDAEDIICGFPPVNSVDQDSYVEPLASESPTILGQDESIAEAVTVTDMTLKQAAFKIVSEAISCTAKPKQDVEKSKTPITIMNTAFKLGTSKLLESAVVSCTTRGTTPTPNTPTPVLPCTSKVNIDISGPSNFISPQSFRPPIKAEPRKKKITRKRGKSIIATDTPEKEALAQTKRKITKTKPKIDTKKVKLARKDLFEQTKKVKKQIVLSDTSNDEDEDFRASGSSSGGEAYVSDSEDDEVILTDVFPPLPRQPVVKDYVIVRFKSKTDDVYYVGQILEVIDDDDECDFYVSFLKLKSKAQQKFTDPLEPDTAGVKRIDIKYILPKPKVEGTNRRAKTYKFAVEMSLLKLRY